MAGSRFVAISAVLLALGGGAALSQSGAAPQEIPPASFTGAQYVDSNGCVFIRAGIGGMVNWIPRVTRERVPLCGFQPSLVANTAAPAPVAAPAIQNPASAPAMQTTATTPVAVAPRPRAAPPARVRTTSAQIAPVASPRTPQVRVATAPTPQQPASRTMTRAEICQGRTGVQSGYISAVTRQPIDCGGTRAAVAAPRAGQQLTFAEICADMSATGRRYVNGRSGMDVRCGPQTQPITSYRVTSVGNMVPAAPAPVMSPASPQMAGTSGATTAPVIITMPAGSAQPMARAGAPVVQGCPAMVNSRFPTRCGPQTESPSGMTPDIAASAPLPRYRALQRTGLFQRPAPFSNPPVGTPEPASLPVGYKAVWDDGRLNPNRGLNY